MTLALLVKELKQHGGPAVALAVTAASVIAIILAQRVWSVSATVLGAPVEGVRLVGPVVCAVVARWLVADEIRSRTAEFLATLPVDTHRILVTKVLVGFTAIVAGFAMAIVVVGGMVRAREIVDVAWLAQLTLQSAAYLWAWFGLFVLGAHLGSIRVFVFVFLLIGGAFCIELNPSAPSEWLWWGSIPETIALSRGRFPVAGTLRALAWGMLFMVAAFALAHHRAGATVRALWRPSSPRSRAIGIASLVVAMSVFGIVTEGFYGRRWLGATPSVGSGPVRCAAPAASPTGRLARELDVWAQGVEQAYGVELDPITVVGLDRGASSERSPWFDGPPEAVVSRSFDAPELQQFQTVATELVRATSRDRWRWDSAFGFVADGLALSLLEPSHRVDASIQERRAALAVQSGLTEAHLSRWRRLRARVGDPVSAAVGWIGLRVLSRHCGPAAHRRLIRAALVPGGAPPRLLWSTCPREGFIPAWWSELERLSSDLEPRLAASSIRRVAGGNAGTLLMVPDSQARSLWWSTLDPLVDEPSRVDQSFRQVSLSPGQRLVQLPVAPRVRVVAALGRWDPQALVFALTPLAEVRPP